MTTESKETEKINQFKVDVDDPQNPTVMVFTVPIKHVSEDISNSAYLMMLGFFEDTKNMAIRNVMTLRKMKQVSQVLIPGNINIPNKPPFKVH